MMPYVIPRLLIFLYSLALLYFIITIKEYERVEGWEDSNAVSPPRDGAAWILRNCIIILEGLRTVQVSLLMLKCKNISHNTVGRVLIASIY